MGEEAKQEEKTTVEEEVKVEEKKEEKAVEEKTAEEEKEEPKPPEPLVIYVDLHCLGCAKKIQKSIFKIRGVVGVVMDMSKNQVTIQGIVEPEAVCKRITKKTKREAKILSPLPSAEGETIPEVVASQVSGLTTVELTVNMHCEACANQLKKKILKMKGVRTVETELSSEKVTVSGTMDPNKLVDYVYRRTKKQAKIVPQPEPEKPAEEANPEDKKEEDQNPAEEAKPEEKKEDGGEKPPEGVEAGDEEKKAKEVEEGPTEVFIETITEEQIMQKMMYHYQPLYVMERIPPPQLFSDENPNACSIS